MTNQVVLLPGRDQAAQVVRAIRTTQAGEMRRSPEAGWIPFTGNEFIDATQSKFRWGARTDPGEIGPPTITDT